MIEVTNSNPPAMIEHHRQLVRAGVREEETIGGALSERRASRGRYHQRDPETGRPTFAGPDLQQSAEPDHAVPGVASHRSVDGTFLSRVTGWNLVGRPCRFKRASAGMSARPPASMVARCSSASTVGRSGSSCSPWCSERPRSACPAVDRSATSRTISASRSESCRLRCSVSSGSSWPSDSRWPWDATRPVVRRSSTRRTRSAPPICARRPWPSPSAVAPWRS